VVLFDDTTTFDFNVKHVEKIFEDYISSSETLTKNVSKSGLVDYVQFGVWDPNLSYGDVSGTSDTWYDINNDYNYPI
jgi:hypothetical protein